MSAAGRSVMTLARSKVVIVVAVLAALVGLYALLGFKVAPGLVRSQAVDFVRETYGRELRIGDIHLHPFKLQIEIRDLAFPDADGQTMLGAERLFADFELSSLWKRAWYFRDVRLEAPMIRAVVRPQGALNLADLAIDEPQPPPEPEPLPGVWIAQLDVTRGVVDFVDQARSRPFERRFSPVEFALQEFRTTPEGGDFRLTAQSQHAEKFDWKGRFALAPIISSSGDFKIEDLRAVGVGEFLADALPFSLSSGDIDLNGRYDLELAETTSLDVELPAIQVANLGLRAQGAPDDWVTIPKLVVSDTKAKLPAQSVAIGRIELSALTAHVWREASGDINLNRLFAPPASAAPATAVPLAAVPAAAAPAADTAATPPPAAADSPAAAPTEWDVQVAAVAVNDATISFEDRSLTPAFATVLAPTDVTLGQISLDLAKPLPITASTKIDDGASLTASGQLTPEPLSAALDVELAGFDLRRLQPYVAGTTDMTIRSGAVSSAGRFEMQPPGGASPELSYSGDVTVTALKTIDNALEEDFVSLERLELRKMRYAMAPDSLSIDRIAVRKPFARVIISSDQVLNVAAVLDPEGTAAALRAREAEQAAQQDESRKANTRKKRDSKQAPKQAPPAEPAPELVETGMPIRIREVRIDGGRMDFADYFIEPNFAAQIDALEGTMKGLSTDPKAHAQVDLKGNVGPYSPVTIAGEIQPFAYDRFTDIGLKFENISLPVFNPYSGRFAGFNIAKGSLTTELDYEIVDRKLDAGHRIRIDQLEWGEATASKEAVPLPIKFATSLLKDVNGVIDLDVPVTGTLDDPKFRIGPIVWQIIKNILVKAVTAPFRLLGSLFEGAEEAQFVDFAPGDATLDPAAAERLGSLAKGLVQKPEIKLDIPIGNVASLDEPALKDKRYADEVAAAMKRVLRKKAVHDGEPVAYESLDPEQQVAVLEDVVQKVRGAPAKLPDPPERAEGVSRKEAKLQEQQAAIAYLESEVRAGLTVAATDVEALSTARATAVQSALLSSGELDPARVFVARSDKVTAHEGKVRLELALE
jgi:uncharacterized protein involved in outer membrane biogenesis